MASPRYADRACLHVYYRHARYEFAPLATKETRKSDRARRSAAPSVKPVSSALGDIFLGGCCRRGVPRLVLFHPIVQASRGTNDASPPFRSINRTSPIESARTNRFDLSSPLALEDILFLYFYLLASSPSWNCESWGRLYCIFENLDGGAFYFEYLFDSRTSYLYECFSCFAVIGILDWILEMTSKIVLFEY